MLQYLDLMERILTKGHVHSDRTGVGRISLYGETLRFDLTKGFPLVTTRKVPYLSIIHELLWFISGSTDNKILNGKNVHIWDNWAVREKDIDKFCKANGLHELGEAVTSNISNQFLNNIGPMYGFLWRNAPVSEVCKFYPEVNEDEVASDKLDTYRGQFMIHTAADQMKLDWPAFLKSCHYASVDQLQQLIVNLKKRPYSARHVVNTWNPTYIPFEDLSPQENVLLGKGTLAPCHVMFQCFVIPNGDKKPKLSMQMTQRSADFPIGSVFNIAQYSLLLCLLAKVTGYEPYEFIYSLGDVHIYSNQVEGVKRQLQRIPKELPVLVISDEVTDIYKCKLEDIIIANYLHHDPINYQIAV
jgi:thymidylate synthase